ncbi:MAG: glycosyl transferase family protein [Methylococcales bacterium]|nr:glycosyl transferase family protein [Methylococcales bacterium]
MTSIPPHPFSEFIKILGKGKRGSRPLTQDEAYRAMKMIVNRDLEPEQLGAFLMLMRVKEETPEELAGFVQAARESLTRPKQQQTIDLDWSSYAGKRRHLPWFILSILLLAENNITIFMHGAGGHTEGRVYTEDVLKTLGLPIATSFEQANQQLLSQNFSYLPLRHFCPALYEIIELRSLMGLRSPVHTLVRLLNPLNARHTLQGIFHPSYRDVHQHAALLLGQQNMAVLKGEGGETERNPDVECLVKSVTEGVLTEEQWPPLFSRRHPKADTLDPVELINVWQGNEENEFAQATIISTAAIALKTLGKATNQQHASDLASQYWLSRHKQRFT